MCMHVHKNNLLVLVSKSSMVERNVLNNYTDSLQGFPGEPGLRGLPGYDGEPVSDTVIKYYNGHVFTRCISANPSPF